MIKIPATKSVAAALLIGGIALAPHLDDGDAFDTPQVDVLPVQTPRFQIQLSQHELTLSGHTLSRGHEDTLLHAAETLYPNKHLTSQFQPLGIIPDDWPETTEKVLGLLENTSSAEATLSGNKLEIRAVVVDEPAWRRRFDTFRKGVSADTNIETDAIVVNPAVDVASICERAFRSFEAGPINFEESRAEFRSSAYPRLDRLIALATACRNSEILITGHTDASGSESLNQRLSVLRANAVGDYIVSGGIERERLQISGIGSAEPIADDSTRFGRSLNRRIEIALSNAL